MGWALPQQSCDNGTKGMGRAGEAKDRIVTNFSQLFSSLQQSQKAMVQQPLPWLHLHISQKAARPRRKSTTPLTLKLQVRFGLGLSSWPCSLVFTLQESACTLPSCRDAGSQADVQRAFSCPPALLPTADEVEAKTQEVSMCLEDIMEKLRSAFPNSRGT